MRKYKLKDRRVINVPKSDYDIIQKHCKEHTLDMPKWIVKNSFEKISTTSMQSMIYKNPIDCLEELKALSNKNERLVILKVYTPADTYEHDPITFDKLPEPRHMDKYGVLVKLEGKI